MTRGALPPRLARRLLARALPIDVREGILDDLDEVFAREVETRGLTGARVAYWRKVASFAVRFAAERLRDGRSQRRANSHAKPGRDWLKRIGLSWMDVKLGVRMLIKYPGLTLVSTLGMAVAIGIGATTFSFFYGYLFPSLPLDEGHRVVGIENWDTSWNNQEHRSLHDFVTWRDELASVEDLGAFRTVRRNLIMPAVPTEQVVVAEMTASGFSLARVPVLLGRPLVETDERKGGPQVVVIGYDVWQTRFGSDPAVVGRRIRLGHAEYEVVGVMPKGFAFPLNHSFWVPLRADPLDYQRRGGPEIFMFGRLAAGVTVDLAQTELTAIGLRAAEAFPETNKRLRPLIVRFAKFWADDLTLGQVNSVQFFVSLLLVVVGVNVAILVYARTATRQSEIVVRTALGASRRRIVMQLFVEALVLAVIAASGGLLLASKSLAVLDSFLAGLSGGEFSGVPFWVDHRLSLGTMIYVGGLAIVAAAITGVLPALKATGAQLQSSLREPGNAASPKLGRMWTGLIVTQVAFAVAILPGGVSFAWQSIRQMAWGPGFAAETFLTTRLLMDVDPVPSARAVAATRAFEARYADRVRELARRAASEPGVSAVTIVSNKPGTESTRLVELDGASQPVRSASRHLARAIYVDSNFFGAFDVPVLTGRPFRSEDLTEVATADWRDADGDGIPDGPVGGATAVIVNRTFVRQILGDVAALGRRLRYVDEGTRGAAAAAVPWHEIVGVVADLPANPVLPGETEARVYHPLAPGRTYPMTLIARLQSGDPATFGDRLREVASALDPTLRLDGILPLSEVYRREQLGFHMGALALGLVGLSVVLLSAAGIYALMSFTVTLRRREIGIRAALGAHPRRLLASIFTRAFVQLSAGVMVGVVAGALLDLLAGGEIMRGRAAVLLPIVSALMGGAGLLAAIGPARRGLRIQPTEALREQ